MGRPKEYKHRTTKTLSGEQALFERFEKLKSKLGYKTENALFSHMIDSLNQDMAQQLQNARDKNELLNIEVAKLNKELKYYIGRSKLSTHYNPFIKYMKKNIPSTLDLNFKPDIDIITQQFRNYLLEEGVSLRLSKKDIEQVYIYFMNNRDKYGK